MFDKKQLEMTKRLEKTFLMLIQKNNKNALLKGPSVLFGKSSREDLIRSQKNSAAERREILGRNATPQIYKLKSARMNSCSRFYW